MNKNLYVGNLSFKVTDEDLKSNFSEAGEVASAAIIKDKFTGQSKGFGFVEMKTEEGAAEAVKKFHGGMLDGKAITVNEARPKKEYGAGGGLIIDEDAAFAGGVDFAAKNDLGAAGINAVFLDDGFGADGGFKNTGDNGFIRAVADDFGGGFAAHEQGQRIDQDGFARAGFSGEQVEAGAEGGDGVIDDGVIFSTQFDEHGEKSSRKRRFDPV